MSDDNDALKLLEREFQRDAERYSLTARKSQAERMRFAERYLPLAKLLVKRGCMLEKDVHEFLRGNIELRRIYCFIAMALIGEEYVSAEREGKEDATGR